jgi:ArsR family transcriptional regulator
MSQPPESASDTATETVPETTTTGCCPAIDTISSEAIDQDVTVLAALANRTRYGALRVLAGADSEVCACNLAPPLDVSQSTVSHALATLYDAGLVARRKEGRWRYYRTTPLADAILAVFDEHEETTHD